MNFRTEPWPFVVRSLTPKLGAAWIAGLTLFASLSCQAADFSFEVASPKFKVTIPGVQQLKMDVHPRNASQPHLRYLGGEAEFTVSVFTPAAGGTHCVEVHTTRILLLEEDVAPWLNTLQKASIEPG